MGVIGKKLASRFRRAKKQLGDLRRQVAADFAQVPKDVKTVEALVRSGHDPLHAAYIAAQNFTSFYAEAVSAGNTTTGPLPATLVAAGPSPWSTTRPTPAGAWP